MHFIFYNNTLFLKLKMSFSDEFTGTSKINLNFTSSYLDFAFLTLSLFVNFPKNNQFIILSLIIILNNLKILYSCSIVDLLIKLDLITRFECRETFIWASRTSESITKIAVSTAWFDITLFECFHKFLFT